MILDRAHIGVVAALAGWALVALGHGIAARQAEIIDWQRRARAERRRRAAQYRM